MSHHTYIIHTYDSTQDYLLTNILISLGANTEDEAQHALRRFDIHLPSHMMLPDSVLRTSSFAIRLFSFCTD